MEIFRYRQNRLHILKQVTIACFFILFGCQKRIVNPIPDYCFDEEGAFFIVNDSLQILTGETFMGVDLSNIYGAKPDGEWSVSLDSESYTLSISAMNFITFTQYKNMSLNEWINTLKTKGSYSLTETHLLQQLIFVDNSTGEIYLQENIKNGQVDFFYQETAGGCYFIKVIADLTVNKDDVEHNIYTQLISTIEKKID
jgi:hypothetical protein